MDDKLCTRRFEKNLLLCCRIFLIRIYFSENLKLDKLQDEEHETKGGQDGRIESHHFV